MVDVHPRSAGNNEQTRPHLTRLEPVRNTLDTFLGDVFLRCDGEGVITVRAYFQNPITKEGEGTVVALFRWQNSQLKWRKYLEDTVEDIARRAANNPEPVVFSPPLATFKRSGNNHWVDAGEDDVYEGPVLSVDMDKNPLASLTKLERVLGPATVVVHSGGFWTNPETGEVEPKLHGHWRLKEPARGDEDIAKLKRARKIAAALVGSDMSGVPVCHPYRWPGSWHCKAKPRLCEIIDRHLDAEIDLDDALAKLEDVAPSDVLRESQAPESNKGDSYAEAPTSMVEAAMNVIPNPDRGQDGELEYEEWRYMGLRIYASTGGSDQGYEIFLKWSKKSNKFNDKPKEYGSNNTLAT